MKRRSFSKFFLLIGLITGIILLNLHCGNGEEAETATEPAETADPMQNKGIGPISNVELGPIDAAQVAQGTQVFQTKCSACHKLDERVVGPPLGGVTRRRSPEWIMNLILNTNEMVEKDPIVQDMIAVYYTKMTFQNVTEPEARALLEYMRKYDSDHPQAGADMQ